MTESPSVLSPSVFLAGPFKALVDDNGAMRPEEKARFESLISAFEDDGYHVYNAHKRESWGKAYLRPEECTKLDYDEIAASTVFVAFPGAPASPGTHVEIGWASAMGKPILLLLQDEAEYAFLIRGLHTVGNVTYMTVRPGEDIAAKVLAMVNELAGAAVAVG
jgi:nucleoside 2-deoxyribosyltransferase